MSAKRVYREPHPTASGSLQEPQVEGLGNSMIRQVVDSSWPNYRQTVEQFSAGTGCVWWHNVSTVPKSHSIVSVMLSKDSIPMLSEMHCFLFLLNELL